MTICRLSVVALVLTLAPKHVASAECAWVVWSAGLISTGEKPERNRSQH
jgi:hypothetical protein